MCGGGGRLKQVGVSVCFKSFPIWSFHIKLLALFSRPGRIAQSVGHLTRKSGPGFDTRSGHILSFLFPLFQEGPLSVTGESMCMRYWLTA